MKKCKVVKLVEVDITDEIFKEEDDKENKIKIADDNIELEQKSSSKKEPKMTNDIQDILEVIDSGGLGYSEKKYSKTLEKVKEDLIAVDLIKRKMVNMIWLSRYDKDKYNSMVAAKYRLIQRHYDFLKEWIKKNELWEKS